MARRKNGQNVHGILLLDKRSGISSNQALQEIKRLLNANKAGHTGSLDPLATGLLPLCFGEATKVSEWMLADNKRYQVTIKLGVMTDTGDCEGKIIAEKPVPAISDRFLQECLNAFIGDIDQVPPMYSALKYQGKKLYELARLGVTIERPARRIHIHTINLIDFIDDLLQLEVYCSKGTYIRSLAEDIGDKLGSCGTVIKLRRTVSGIFSLANALTFEQFQQLNEQTRLEKLISVDQPLSHMPLVTLSTDQATRIKQGQQISLLSDISGLVRIYSQTSFLGLGELTINGKLVPRKIFQLEAQIA